MEAQCHPGCINSGRVQHRKGHSQERGRGVLGEQGITRTLKSETGVLLPQSWGERLEKKNRQKGKFGPLSRVRFLDGRDHLVLWESLRLFTLPQTKRSHLPQLGSQPRH